MHPMFSVELEEIRLDHLERSRGDVLSHINRMIEDLCERARLKGPSVRVAIGCSIQQDPRTFSWHIPYVLLEDGSEPLLCGRNWTIYGPFPPDTKKGGEAEAPPPLDR